MGNWYVNTVVKGVEQKTLGDFLNRTGRRAVVLPTINEYTVVCDEASESFDEKDSRLFNEDLSKSLGCKTITFMNADDDLLFYRLYEKGKMVDEYYSSEGAYEAQNPSPYASDDNRTHARRLKQFLGIGDESKLERILSSEYVFAVERHAELEAALGIQNSAGIGYKYATHGELPTEITNVVVTGE